MALAAAAAASDLANASAHGQLEQSAPLHSTLPQAASAVASASAAEGRAGTRFSKRQVRRSEAASS